MHIDQDSKAHELLKPDLSRVLEPATLSPICRSSIRVHRNLKYGYAPLMVGADDLAGLKGPATWSLERAENFCPTVEELVNDIAQTLWLPAERIASTLFVSSSAMGLPWHFDPVEVLVIPLQGEKIWFLKENKTIKFPSKKFIPSAGREPEAELTINSIEELEEPDQADFTWHAKPGSVCYLPRGWWHKTEARGDSVSLSIALDTPRLMDILLSRLQLHLATIEHWRAPVSMERMLTSNMSGTVASIISLLNSSFDTLNQDTSGDPIK
jgi:ribosomal protein L16 Arg81 hydroxylase